MKKDMRTSENIKKITTGQGDDYKTSCLLDYLYFKAHCKLVALDWSKQALYLDQKVTKQTN